MNTLISKNVSAPPIPAFKEKLRQVTPKGHHVYDMSQAVPAFPTFQEIRRRLQDALHADETSFYTDVPGLPALREKIATTHPLSAGLSARKVLVTAGANHAMYTALTLYFNIGDTVLLLEPHYFNYDMALKMIGLKVAYSRVERSNGFQMKASKVIEDLTRTGAKGVILITPNNPTGACYDSGEILALLKWTKEHGVRVILDETYLRFDSQHLNHQALAPYIDAENGLSLVGSFSKCFSLTGYRVGYFITNEAALEQCLKIQDTMVICAPNIAQMAALYGLESCLPDAAKKAAEYRSLEQHLRRLAGGLRKFHVASSGAFFAYLEHPFTGMTCEDAAVELYRNTGIISLPGTVFGESQTSYVRLAFCNLNQAQLDGAFGMLSDYEKRL